MSESEVRGIFQNKSSVIDKISSCSDSFLREKLTIIMDNLVFLEDDYSDLIEALISSSVNYSSYYSPDYTASENVRYFKSCYQKVNKDEELSKYMLYGFLKNIDELIFLAADDTLFSSFEELASWLDFGSYYSDLIYYSEELKRKLILEEMTRKKESDSLMDFMKENNPYKILFLGHSYEDVSELPRHVRLQVMNKLYSPLATEKVVPMAEGVDHVRDLFDFPLQRIRVGDGYRIAYVRRGNVTAILGAKGKTGKNNDYTRYDSVVKDANKIYEEMENFSLGIAPVSDIHLKTVELFQEAYDKSREK